MQTVAARNVMKKLRLLITRPGERKSIIFNVLVDILPDLGYQYSITPLTTAPEILNQLN
jgi:hypothetical protein